MGTAGAAAAAFEDRALTRREEASLLHPLLRLRQACCHPQVCVCVCVWEGLWGPFGGQLYDCSWSSGCSSVQQRLQLGIARGRALTWAASHSPLACHPNQAAVALI